MPSFFEGLSNGIFQGRQLSQAKEEKELRKKQIQLEAKLLENKLELEGRKQGVIDKLSTQEPTRQDGTIAAPLQNAGQKPPSLAERMAGLSIGDQIALGLNPQDTIKNQQAAESRGLFERLIGGNLGGQSGEGGQGGYSQPTLKLGSDGGIDATFTPQEIKRTVQTVDQNNKPITLALDGQGNVIKGFAAQPNIQLIDVENPDGSTSKVPIDINSLNGGNSGINTKPAQEDMFVPEGEKQNFIDKTTLSIPQGNVKYGDLNDEDRYVRVTSKQRDQVGAVQNAFTTLNEINDLAVNIFDQIDNEFGSRGKEGAKLFINNFTQENPDAITYQTLNSELVTLIRAMGDVGAISDTQVNEATNLIPKMFPVPDSKDVAVSKMDKLFNVIGAPIGNILGEEYIPKRRTNFTGSRKKETPVNDAVDKTLDSGIKIIKRTVID
jgi:hypothetical protein